MRKSKLALLAFVLWPALAWSDHEPQPTAKKKLTLQDLLRATSSAARPADVQGARGLVDANSSATVDTKARDANAIDRLEHVVVHEDELGRFIADGQLKEVSVTVSSVTSDAQEIQLGREVAANLAARYGLVEDASEVKYVNLVGVALASHSERKKIPYHFGILHTSEVNSLAAPGGYVFITQGLLGTLKDESELAGILAHEISHVTHQHIMKAIRNANPVPVNDDLAPLADYSVKLLTNGLSREDELEADKYGTLLAWRTGYDAYGLRRSIEGLAAKRKTPLVLDSYNKTHPPAKDRFKKIDRTIYGAKLGKTGQRLGDRFIRRLAGSTR